MKKQKLFVRIVCIVLVVLMAVSVGAVAITAFSANAAQSTEEVSASVSAGASGYINASYVNLRSGAGTNYSVITCMAKNTKFTFVDGKLYNSKWYKFKDRLCYKGICCRKFFGNGIKRNRLCF